MQQEHTAVKAICQHPLLVLKGVHGHTDVCVCACGCVHACVLPVRLLSSSVFVLGSDFKSGPKANEGSYVSIGVLETKNHI